MSKCKLWSSFGVLLNIKIFQGCTFIVNGLCIFGVLVGSQDFVTHFLGEVLSQDMAQIDDLFLLGDIHVVLDIMSSCVVCRPFYFTWTILHFSSFLSILASFNRRIMYVCGDIIGLRSWEFNLGPFNKV